MAQERDRPASCPAERRPANTRQTGFDLAPTDRHKPEAFNGGFASGWTRMSRRTLRIVLALIAAVATALYAYRWFTPDSPAELARVGECERYREANQRLESGLDSEAAADPAEIAMVLDACERQGR